MLTSDCTSHRDPGLNSIHMHSLSPLFMRRLQPSGEEGVVDASLCSAFPNGAEARGLCTGQKGSGLGSVALSE